MDLDLFHYMRAYIFRNLETLMLQDDAGNEPLATSQCALPTCFAASVQNLAFLKFTAGVITSANTHIAPQQAKEMTIKNRSRLCPKAKFL